MSSLQNTQKTKSRLDSSKSRSQSGASKRVPSDRSKSYRQQPFRGPLGDPHRSESKLISFIRKPDLKSGDKSLRTLDDRKLKSLSETDSSSISSLLVNPLQVYRLRLGGYTTLSMSAGVTNTFLAADPSAAGWNSGEWSLLSGLFSEFKLVQLGCTVIRNFNTTALAAGTLAIASNLGSAANPGSYAGIADNADVTWYSYTSTTNGGKTHVMNATGLAWSEMTTPTTAPYAGAPGSIQFYAINDAATGTVASQYQLLIWGIYDFRIRV